MTTEPIAGTDAASTLRSFAERLASDAGRLALDGRRQMGVGQPVAHDTKSSATDPVTKFDRAAESLLVEAIRKARPNDSIVGEEGARYDGTSGLEWHLDPIDGTANFVYGLPAWCTSVAVVDQHGPLSGAVYWPEADELFSAARNRGATLNGESLHCSSADHLATALIGTGFSYLPDRRRAQAARIAAMLPLIRDIRRLGSAALDLCMVASGRLDGYFEQHLNSWDLAAGVLIAAEAGAITTDFEGRVASPEAVVASAPAIHEALLQLINSAGE